MTHNVVMRAKSGTIRYIRSIRQLDTLMRFSQVDYTHTYPVFER